MELPVNLEMKSSLVLFGMLIGCMPSPSNSPESDGGDNTHTDGGPDDSGNDGSTSGPGGDGDGDGDAESPFLSPTGTWKRVTGNLAGMDSECGNMSALSVKPDADTLIAGIAQKGLWASEDGGATWQALGAEPGADVITNRTTSIVYDPIDAARFWQTGIYSGGGLYETTNDGDGFYRLGDVEHVDLLSVDLSDPDRKVMVAGGHEAPQALFLSKDSGATWKSIGAGLPGDRSCTHPLVINAKTFLVGCSYGGEGIYRSTDAGESWTLVSEVGGSRAPLRASDDSLYWAAENNGGLMRSTDDGKTWTQVTGHSVVTSTAPLELPDGRLAMLGTAALLSSDDKGATWHPISTQLPYGDASGVVYSAQQKAFFIWHFTCGFDGPVPVPDDAIMRYDYDYKKL